ncbi:unnamed protein product [Amoebophrya sp. A120]|nr:unnamed protein product [Amoebophrya sp. A120]|eukprot:GSA120T00023771001.1
MRRVSFLPSLGAAGLLSAAGFMLLSAEGTGAAQSSAGGAAFNAGSNGGGRGGEQERPNTGNKQGGSTAPTARRFASTAHRESRTDNNLASTAESAARAKRKGPHALESLESEVLLRNNPREEQEESVSRKKSRTDLTLTSSRRRRKDVNMRGASSRTESLSSTKQKFTSPPTDAGFTEAEEAKIAELTSRNSTFVSPITSKQRRRAVNSLRLAGWNVATAIEENRKRRRSSSSFKTGRTGTHTAAPSTTTSSSGAGTSATTTVIASSQPLAPVPVRNSVSTAAIISSSSSPAQPLSTQQDQEPDYTTVHSRYFNRKAHERRMSARELLENYRLQGDRDEDVVLVKTAENAIADVLFFNPVEAVEEFGDVDAEIIEKEPVSPVTSVPSRQRMNSMASSFLEDDNSSTTGSTSRNSMLINPHALISGNGKNKNRARSFSNASTTLPPSSPLAASSAAGSSPSSMAHLLPHIYNSMPQIELPPREHQDTEDDKNESDMQIQAAVQQEVATANKKSFFFGSTDRGARATAAAAPSSSSAANNSKRDTKRAAPSFGDIAKEPHPSSLLVPVKLEQLEEEDDDAMNSPNLLEELLPSVYDMPEASHECSEEAAKFARSFLAKKALKFGGDQAETSSVTSTCMTDVAIRNDTSSRRGSRGDTSHYAQNESAGDRMQQVASDETISVSSGSAAGTSSSSSSSSSTSSSSSSSSSSSATHAKFSQNKKTSIAWSDSTPLSVLMTSLTLTTTSIPEVNTENDFSRATRSGVENKKKVLQYLKDAKRWIDIAMWVMTDKDVEQEINKAVMDRKVHVRILVDSRQASNPGMRQLYQRFLDNGIPVTLIYQGEYRGMHSKFIIIDGLFVLTGSLNLTVPGFEWNRENVVVLRDEHAITRYIREFDMRFRDPAHLAKYTLGHRFFYAAFVREQEMRMALCEDEAVGHDATTGLEQQQRVDNMIDARDETSRHQSCRTSENAPRNLTLNSEGVLLHQDHSSTALEQLVTTSTDRGGDPAGSTTSLALVATSTTASSTTPIPVIRLPRPAQLRRSFTRDGRLTKQAQETILVETWESMTEIVEKDRTLIDRWAAANVYNRRTCVKNAFDTESGVVAAEAPGSSTSSARPATSNKNQVVEDVLFFPEDRVAHKQTKAEKDQVDKKAMLNKLKRIFWQAEESIDMAMHQLEEEEMVETLTDLLSHRPWLRVRITVDNNMLTESKTERGKAKTLVYELRDSLLAEQKKLRHQSKHRTGPLNMLRKGNLENEIYQRWTKHPDHYDYDLDEEDQEESVVTATEEYAERLTNFLKSFERFNFEIRRSHTQDYEEHYENKARMHHKFVVIDRNKYLITGSFNWTSGAANRNMENIVVLKNHEILFEKFNHEFSLLWQEYEGAKKTEGRLTSGLQCGGPQAVTSVSAGVTAAGGAAGEASVPALA